jgi:hypothetical protein
MNLIDEKSFVRLDLPETSRQFQDRLSHSICRPSHKHTHNRFVPSFSSPNRNTTKERMKEERKSSDAHGWLYKTLSFSFFLCLARCRRSIHICHLPVLSPPFLSRGVDKFPLVVRVFGEAKQFSGDEKKTTNTLDTLEERRRRNTRGSVRIDD